MEAGKIIIFEDDPETLAQAMATVEASDSQHQVVATASTLPDALDVLDRVLKATLECDIVVLDSSLTPAASEGQDARILAEAIRMAEPSAKIIGLAVGEMATYGVHVDVDLGKPNLPELRRVIDEL